ncbi:hypothetical protein DXT99_23635 [Pontibacter diazotrophicus]|uniref:Uncharacterized protein n=1 Tax=Pontibacter diazotrophicus TaxID=1400979 RepID=A0A3D8L354_9BACT|nr:hypothetical protein [Pontibacter diazotrophicus]RDV11899.1 hypothetical protein DXT99_23635 [Pontibacter diazotrophicus]
MIEVYHRVNYEPNIVLEADVQINQEDYEAVAEIDSDAVGDAWNLTQNGYSSWVKGRHVKALLPGDSRRSSSIGDVFSVNGQLQVILFEGYAPIEWGAKVDFRPSFMANQ